MKVLIDFSQIPLKKVGVGVYGRHLLGYIAQHTGENEYIAIIQDDDNELIELCGSSVKTCKIKSKFFRRFFFRFLLEQIYIPFLIAKYHVDVIHSLHYSFPLIKLGAKRVITIHDLTFFIYPELHTTTKRYYFRWFIGLATKTKNYLVCVSQSTANDLIRFFPKAKSEISVIPLAVDHHPAFAKIKDIKTKFELSKPYVLFIGTLEPRKNIERLIDAYAKIEQRIDCDLVIVGKKGWYYESIFEKVNELTLKNRVIFTGFVIEEEKIALLKECFIFAYISLYEGFGLPVLEALNESKAVITSNVSSMPEVAGNAALLVDPMNTDQIADNILKLAKDTEFRNALSNLACKQAAKYTWANTSQETIILYKNCSTK